MHIDTTKHQIHISDLRTEYLTQLLHRGDCPVYYNYDAVSDSLYIAFDDRNVIAVGHDVDRYVVLYAKLDDHEIMGIEIEGFRHHFLAQEKYPVCEWKLSNTGLWLANGGDLHLHFESIAEGSGFTAQIYAYDQERVVFSYQIAA